MHRFYVSKYNIVNIFLWYSIIIPLVPFLYFIKIFYSNETWTRVYGEFAILYLQIYLYFLIAFFLVIGIIIEIVYVKNNNKNLTNKVTMPKFLRFFIIMIAISFYPAVAYLYYIAVNLCEYIYGKG